MDISNSPKPSAAAQAAKTEFALDPSSVPSKNKPAEKTQEAFGAMLNRMSGVEDKKNLYKEDEKNKMSKESYLKMMMEQIKYQDPFNPVKNEQFTQNMAMMSQLEQQMNMNKNLEKIANQNNNMQIAALQLVGKNIQADHAAVYHEAGKFSNIEFNLPQDAKDLSVEIVGANGEVLKSINLGPQNQGAISTKWDGLFANEQPAPSGKYSYRIKAQSMEGGEISIPSKIDGKVTGVTNSQGVTYLLVGEQRVALNEVEVIRDSEAKAVPSAAVADFVKNVPSQQAASPANSASAAAMPSNEVKKTASNDGNSAGTETATEVDIDEDAERELGGGRSERSPLEKEHLNDLMQVMFR